MRVAFDGFEDYSIEDIMRDFEVRPKDRVHGAELLFAVYELEDYEGSAKVVYRLGGVIYEVSGAHCSCYGLEGQWEPEETSLEAMRKYDGQELFKSREARKGWARMCYELTPRLPRSARAIELPD